ncbi:MAG: hypothetical protein ABF271_02225 [Abyssibacter sp.]|jgi:hypothetical protein|uniref:hypothetical protein n=1 Tax=Abyssibacter sp. TaxID=2320200 RepID=UPI00321C2BB6
MADWTTDATIATEAAPDKPVKATTPNKIQENITAQAEGAAGAPKQQRESLELATAAGTAGDGYIEAQGEVGLTQGGGGGLAGSYKEYLQIVAGRAGTYNIIVRFSGTATNLAYDVRLNGTSQGEQTISQGAAYRDIAANYALTLAVGDIVSFHAKNNGGSSANCQALFQACCTNPLIAAVRQVYPA